MKILEVLDVRGELAFVVAVDSAEPRELQLREAVCYAIKAGIDLSGADLHGADLRFMDLSGMNLTKVNFRKANLDRVNFEDTDLSWACLQEASLQHAHLRDATLRQTTFDYADLSEADLSGVYATLASFWNANLHCANLIGADLSLTTLGRADFSHAELDEVNFAFACLERVNMQYCSLSHIPRVENIHQKVYAAAKEDEAFCMNEWHSCDTTHCRGGWAIVLAGEEGLKLEGEVGPETAATLIYMASDPTLEQVPDFYETDAQAMANMKYWAEVEAAADKYEPFHLSGWALIEFQTEV